MFDEEYSSKRVWDFDHQGTLGKARADISNKESFKLVVPKGAVSYIVHGEG